MLTTRIEDELNGICGNDSEKTANHPSRCDGPQFVWRTLCGAVALEGNRSTCISRCWRRTADWLNKLANAKTSDQAATEQWKIRFYAHDFPPYPTPEVYKEMVAFKVWRDFLTPAIIGNKIWVNCFAASALKIAEAAEAQADHASTARFLNWLHEGPAAGLGRQHKLSRVATGWIAARTGNDHDEQDGDEDQSDDVEVANGVSSQQLAEAITVQNANTTPLSAQQTVNIEAKEWGAQWAESEIYETLSWPDEANCPPSDLSVQKFREACLTFSADTGLGWDALHPRALCRCSDLTLALIITVLARAERTGNWPEAVQVIVIVLPPKSDGGFRPIGLIPWLPRIWMRARRDVATHWERTHDRPYLYAGPAKGADVAAWKQAARAEHAVKCQLVYGIVLLDLCMRTRCGYFGFLWRLTAWSA